MANGILDFGGFGGTGGYPQWLLDLLNPQAAWASPTIGDTRTFVDPFIDQSGTMDLNPLLGGMDATPFDSIEDAGLADDQIGDDQDPFNPDDISPDQDDEILGVSGEELGLEDQDFVDDDFVDDDGVFDDTDFLEEMGIKVDGGDQEDDVLPPGQFRRTSLAVPEGQSFGQQPQFGGIPFVGQQPAAFQQPSLTPSQFAAAQSMQPPPSPRPPAMPQQAQAGGMRLQDFMPDIAHVIKGLSPYSKVDPYKIAAQQEAEKRRLAAEARTAQASSIAERGMQLRETAARRADEALKAQQAAQANFLKQLKDTGGTNDPAKILEALADNPNISKEFAGRMIQMSQHLDRMRVQAGKAPSIWMPNPDVPGGVQLRPGVAEGLAAQEEAKRAAAEKTKAAAEQAEREREEKAMRPGMIRTWQNADELMKNIEVGAKKVGSTGLMGQMTKGIGASAAGQLDVDIESLESIMTLQTLQRIKRESGATLTPVSNLDVQKLSAEVSALRKAQNAGGEKLKQATNRVRRMLNEIIWDNPNGPDAEQRKAMEDRAKKRKEDEDADGWSPIGGGYRIRPVQ